MKQNLQQLTVKKRQRIHKLQLWALDHPIQERQVHDDLTSVIPKENHEAAVAGQKNRQGAALQARFKSGPPAKLTIEQLQTLPELLLKPPQAYGFTGTVWTYKQIALLIEQVYHVSFSPDYIPDFLKRARRRLEKCGTEAR